MFGSNKQKQPPINTLVGSGARIFGDIEFSGGCLIDGRVKGNIRAVGQGKSMLSVSEQGSVEGTVTAPNILLNGTVQGDVHATARIELGPKSRVIGNVQYKLIEMSIGAEVNGKLIHDTDQSAAATKPAPGSAMPVKAVGDLGQ